MKYRVLIETSINVEAESEEDAKKLPLPNSTQITL